MYIEALLLPVKTAAKADYLRIARAMSEVMMEYGATGVTESWGDDVLFGTLTSFPRALKLEEDETVVLSWITYPDKATRDSCMTTGMEDPRIAPLMAEFPADTKRMIFGGFQTMLSL